MNAKVDVIIYTEVLLSSEVYSIEVTFSIWTFTIESNDSATSYGNTEVTYLTMVFCFQRKNKHESVTLKLIKRSLVLYAVSLLHKGLDKDLKFVLKYISKQRDQAISSFFLGWNMWCYHKESVWENVNVLLTAFFFPQFLLFNFEKQYKFSCECSI